jgi:hypothetical protein
MALPSGNFYSAYAGSLRISCAATITGSAFSTDYNNWGTRVSDVVLRARVNTGSALIYLPIISRLGPSSEIVLPYPGGGQVWALGIDELSYSISGAGTCEATNIYLLAELFKR